MPLQLGMVGFGPQARGWYLELTLNPSLHGKTHIIAAYDPNPTACIEISKKKIPAKTSFDDLINTPGIQAVFISSPPPVHAQQAIAALEAGLHVYSEIPMALTRDEIEKIINTQDKQPKAKYMLGENYCFISEVLYAAHLVEQNKIGPIVYSEAEYLHDITYRWRHGGVGGPNIPKIDSWYSLFDPLAYAHSIGPAQIAMGGLTHPMPFIEVQSYVNDLGGENNTPICLPAHAFHVALFRSATGAIAKCANAYIFAREPSRVIIQVTGRYGTYECYKIGGRGRLFLTKDHLIAHKHRIGSTHIIGQHVLRRIIPISVGGHWGANARTVNHWLDAINLNKEPILNARVGGNMSLAGIVASEAARSGKIMPITDYTSKS